MMMNLTTFDGARVRMEFWNRRWTCICFGVFFSLLLGFGMLCERGHLAFLLHLGGACNSTFRWGPAWE